MESVTVIEDMLPVLRRLIEDDTKGIYHLVNKGTISPFEIGVLMGGKHSPVTKRDLDWKMEKAGRAYRVTSLINSVLTELLPDIRGRITQIIREYKSI